MDSSSVLLSEWLQELGFPMKLSPEDLRQLNSPEMKPIWTHLRTHVKPKFQAQTIKKNLLRKKLVSASTSGQSALVGNFKVESIQDLTAVEEINNIQEDIDSLKKKTEELDCKLSWCSSVLAVKKAEVNVLKDELEEVEEKSSLLELQAESIKETIRTIDEDMVQVDACLLSIEPSSYQEIKQNQATVANFVQQLANEDIKDDNLFTELLSKTVQFAPITVFNGILGSLSLSLRSLRSNLLENMRSNEQSDTKLIDVSLRKLNAEIVCNEIEIFNSSKELNKLSAEFENSIEALAKIVKETVLHDEEEDDASETIRMLSDFVHRVRLKEKNCKTRLFLEELSTSCEEVGVLKPTLDSNREERERMKHLLDEKVNNMSELLKDIFSRTEAIKLIMSNAPKKHSELASKFFTDYNLSKTNDDLCHFDFLKDKIDEEVHLFLEIPLAALIRKWEDECGDHTVKVNKQLSRNQSLCTVLLHSELKDVTVNLLEKLYRLHNSE